MAEQLLNPRDVLLALMRERFSQYSMAMGGIANCEHLELSGHHEAIVQKLEAVERGEIMRLMIFMPPQHGKSTLVSKLFPAWYLGRNPTHSIISAGYGQDFVKPFGRVVRNLMNAPLHQLAFPRSELSGDSQAAHQFNLLAGGEYYAVGRGSPTTGRGANIVIIDDPIKDWKEAYSSTVRQELKDWYSTVLRTRQRHGCRFIIVQTRWHVDDLAGWILREHANTEDWDVLSLPALAEDNDPLGRELGEALWPSHFNREFLENERELKTSREWVSLYQQRPTVGAGYLFDQDCLRFYDPDQMGETWRNMHLAIVVDPANSEKKSSDYTYMWVIGASEDRNYYILDCVRDRFTLVDRAQALFDLHKKWGQPTVVGYEQYGMQADIDHIRDKQDRELYHFNITPVSGSLAKADRIERLEPLFRQFRIWLPKELIYFNRDGTREDLVRVFIEEEFSNYVQGGGGVRHDDGLDALSRLFDVKLTFPTTSFVSGAISRFRAARARRNRGATEWSA